MVVYVASELLGPLKEAFPDAWTGVSVNEADLFQERTVLRSAADLEVIDGVAGFHFDMSGTAEFGPLRTIRGLVSFSTDGEGATYVIGDTLCTGTQVLARRVPLEKWSYLRVDPQVADVTAERCHSR